MNFKHAQKELRLINNPNNSYLYYNAISIIESVLETSNNEQVSAKLSQCLQELKRLENPFNFDKTLNSQSGLVKLIDIVGEVQSYLES